jgi:hypothetical protein
MAGTWWQQLRTRLRESGLLPAARPRRGLRETCSVHRVQVLLERTVPSATATAPSHGLSLSGLGEALSSLDLNLALDGGDSLRSLLESFIPEDFEFGSSKQSAREIRRANRQARREHRRNSHSDGDSDLTSPLQTALQRPNRAAAKRLF